MKAAGFYSAPAKHERSVSRISPVIIRMNEQNDMMKKRVCILNRKRIFLLIISLALLALSSCSFVPVASGNTTAQATAATTKSIMTTQATTTAAPTTASETSVPFLSGEMSWDDLAVVINGELYTMFGEAAALVESMGQPALFSEAPSCLYEGNDKTYEYADLVLYTITKNSKDLVDGIDLVTDKWQTRRGIKVGSSREDVLAAYGEPFSADMDLIYIADQSLGEVSARITFVFHEDLVSTISIYSGSNNAGE
jgi:hypothetical protein